MSQLDEVISKIPKPVLVFVVLFLALIFIIQQNPLSDGCAVEVENFNMNTKGVLSGYRDSKKRVHFPQINFLKERCSEGNSQGACFDYLKSLRTVTDSLKLTSEKCYPDLIESSTELIKQLKDGVKVMALVAWGEYPPTSLSQRLGWLTESDVYTFCRMKNTITKLIPNEEFLAFRNTVYREFPDRWTENISLEKRAEMPRPRALKGTTNPNGTLIEKDLYERSLFSLRCDLYL